MTAGERITTAFEPTVVALTGELDAGDAAWMDELRSVIDSGTDQIVLDLRDVSFIDSSVIRELLRVHRAVQPDGWVRLVYTHNVISRIIDVCGLSELFPQYLTPESAGRGHSRHGSREVREEQS